MWTDARVATLTKLWAEGLTASQIAKQLGGITRNAAIGKAHRLGLAGRVYERKERATAPRRAVNANRIKGARIAAQKPKAEPPQPIEPLNIPFITREHGQCAWVTDAEPFAQRVCGHPVAEGSVYCAAHTALAYARSA